MIQNHSLFERLSAITHSYNTNKELLPGMSNDYYNTLLQLAKNLKAQFEAIKMAYGINEHEFCLYTQHEESGKFYFSGAFLDGESTHNPDFLDQTLEPNQEVTPEIKHMLSEFMETLEAFEGSSGVAYTVLKIGSECSLSYEPIISWKEVHESPI